MRPPVTEPVPLHSKSLCKNFASTSDGANNMRPLRWGGGGSNGKDPTIHVFPIFYSFKFVIFRGTVNVNNLGRDFQKSELDFFSHNHIRVLIFSCKILQYLTKTSLAFKNIARSISLLRGPSTITV